MIRRILIATACCFPGIIIAMAAKPLFLGEAIMFLGIFLAFVAPINYLISTQMRDQN